MARFSFVGIFFAAVVGGNLSADEPTEVSEGEALVKAAKGAELHGIVVPGPAVTHLDQKSVKAWPKLFTTLRDSKVKAVTRVREYMKEDVFKLPMNDDVLSYLEYLDEQKPRYVRDSDEVSSFKSCVIWNLHKVVEDRDFYTESSFKGLALDDETKRLVALGDKRTTHQVTRMNWLLLRAIFPDSMPDLPPGFRKIRVQVRGERNVVLVLSSSSACLWDIDVTPGSRISGALLCGYHTQELELHENPIKDVPTVYRAGHALDGTPTYQSFQRLNGHESSDLRAAEKLDVRRRFEAAIWKLTGKSAFDSVQRNSSAKPEGYCVPPKEKK